MTDTATPPDTEHPEPSLRTGIIWNLASLVVLGFAGIALNLIIGRSYGPETLGLFNIIFALFILFSQLCTFGIHFSVLRTVSQFHGRDAGEVSAGVSSAISATLIASAIVLPICVIATFPLASVYSGLSEFKNAWFLAIPGLLFFSLNKVLLSVVNGMRHMRAFAVLQSLRFGLIILFLVLAIVFDIPGWALSGILTGGELVLFPIVLVYVLKQRVIKDRIFSGLSAIKDRFRFGVKVFLSGTLSELNTRVDVLMIGIFLDAVNVGIYTIAVLVFDAASQLIFVVRNNVNPLITKSVEDGKLTDMLSLSRKIAAAFFVVMLVAAAAAYLIYPLLAPIVLKDPEFIGATVPMAILVASFAFAGGAMCFNMAFTQAGLPGWQTLFVGAVIVVNIVANALLIPMFGINGAAMATAFATVISGVLAVVLIRRLTGLRILI
ncbi:MAG: oligosaccharide flippase family protein [Pseudomonadota bacterium]